MNLKNEKNKISMPRIERYQGVDTLIVNEEPFIILGGEIHNSSASNLDFMEAEVWPYLKGMNLNTLIVPVYWECIEPQEGDFDFSLVRGIVERARQEGIKIVFLWFGLWKNAESMYVPQWMKTDQEKYFPVCTYYGKPINTISPLCQEAVMKDARAFQELMKYIKKIDDREHTVIMVQIENEIGLLGTERDYGFEANKSFNQAVPSVISEHFHVEGTWKEAFGENAEEYFSAYYFAKAIEYIAQAGKKIYELPFYVNAWLEQFPWRPGTYPSGGPVMKMKEIWKLITPSIAFMAPDIYVSYAPKVMDEYTHLDNPLFIPEIRKDAVVATYALYAVGGCHAIGIAPFGIEELKMPPEKIDKIPSHVLEALNIDITAFDVEGSDKYLSKSYEIINQIRPIYYQKRGTQNLQAFIRKNSEDLGVVLSFDKYDMQINYKRKERYQPESGGMVIQIGEDEFYIIGTSFNFQFLPKVGSYNTVNYVSVEEGQIKDGIWMSSRILNGDERMHLKLKDMPGILRVKLCQSNK